MGEPISALFYHGRTFNTTWEAAEEHSLHARFYDAYYQAVLHSPAHALFCERVYGKDLAQHGIADMDQIALLLRELDL
jgi:hypothetical protein